MRERIANARRYATGPISSARRYATDLLDRSRRYRVIDVTVRSVTRTFERDFTHMAAGVAYFAILSLFPLVLAGVSIASLFFEPDYVTEQAVAFLGEYMPVSVDLVERNVQGVLELRGTLSAVSILMLMWTGAAMFAALSRVVNRVWGIEERRSFIKEKIRHLAMVLVTGVLFAASILSTIFLQIAGSFEFEMLGGSRIWSRGIVQVATYAVGLTLTTMTFLLLYRFLPNADIRWRNMLPGAVTASVLFELLKAGFVIYLANFSNPELVYGSLSSVVLIMLWCYFSAHVFIFGAALSAECRIERRAALGSEVRSPYA